MTKYYRPPTPGADTKALVLFIMENGLGKSGASGVDADPWTISGLADALSEIGQQVSEGAIQNWRSGKHPPSLDNMRGLALLVSNTQSEREEWLGALRQGAAIAKARRQSTPAKPKTCIHEDPRAPTNRETETHRESASTFIVSGQTIGLIILMLTLAGVALFSLQPRAAPHIANLKVCDRANFSSTTKTCTRNMVFLPAGTRTVYTSFELVNVPEGASFERIWFRCGREFITRTSRNTAPWEGWTWTNANELSQEGPFAINVTAGETIASHEFVIGDASAVDCTDI